MAQKEDIIYSSIPIGDYEEDEEEFKGGDYEEDEEEDEEDEDEEEMLEVDAAFNQWEYVVEQRLREQATAAGPSASMFERSVSGMDLIAMQQDEAHRVIDSIRNFAINHNQDPGDMLDEIYTRMTGLERTRPPHASRSSSPDPRDPDYWAKVADKGKGKAEPDKDKGKGSGKGKGEGRQTFLQDYWTKAAEKGKGDGPRDAGL